MLTRLAELPLLVVLLGLSGVIALVPALYALGADDNEHARNFMYSALILLVLTVMLGIGFMLQFTLINTLLQTRVSNEMRGRVMSLYTLTFFGFTPFGNLALGALAEWISMSVAITLAAFLTFCHAVSR